MFESTPQVPPDPIFSLNDQYKADPNPEKINLTIGAFQNESGQTPVMSCVKEAEKRLLAGESTKNYLRIGGMEEFNLATVKLLLGSDSQIISNGLYDTIQTPGGTGALRIVAEYLNKLRPNGKLWIGQPSWANHMNIFSQANVQIENYDYLDSSKTELNFESMVDALRAATENDAFLFHACCHNPSGCDLDIDQWEIVFGFLRERNILPIFDCAYQGFHESLDNDVFPIRRLVELGAEFLICSSNSKNFGLYGERVGAITAVCQTTEQADSLGKYLESLIRAIYSNPPKHGAYIVATILNDPELREMWEQELATVRNRIREMRELFVREMNKLIDNHDFDFLLHQRGMFSFTGLSPEQVDTLREKHSIYALRSGRINVAGINSANVDRLCNAIYDVRQVTV